MKKSTTILVLSGVALVGIALALGSLLAPLWSQDGGDKQRGSSALNAPAAYRAGNLRLDVQIDPRAPRVGNNRLTVTLRDAEGRPVNDASIKAVAEMPAMGAMPAMQASAAMAQTAPGHYEGTFELSMKGGWPLSLSIRAPGMQPRQVSFDMATGREGLELSGGATRAGESGESSESSETSDGAVPGAINLDTKRRQLIGVTTAPAEVASMTREIRAVGEVRYDQTRLADISLKFDAWVGELYAHSEGVYVEEGEPLFTVYGPELLAAQQEYLQLKKRGGAASTLIAAARKRLALWNMSAGEIAELERRGEPFDYVTVRAPITGTIIARNVVAGTAMKAGMTMLRIADLSQVWVEADVYEGELPLVRAGMSAAIVLPYVPGKRFPGTVDFVYPTLDSVARTGRVRVVLANTGGTLKPGMYAEVRLLADLGARLSVPEQAVIVAGEARLVFEDLGGGQLAPRRVTTGQRAGGRMEILSGLESGDLVVTSGNFLLASESQLKAGVEQW